LSTTHDDDFEFDFFDEPDEETITHRRGPVRAPQKPKRGPRRPAGPPSGFTPILRLVGLIAFAILVVVLLVFWIQGCQNSSKEKAYKDYLTQVAAVARASSQTGKTLNSVLVTPGIKQAELEQKIDGLAQQEQQNVQHAQSLNPPGHLRQVNQQLIEALQLRVSGIRGLANAFRSQAKAKDTAKAGAVLAEQAKRLIASDVVWDDLFQAPATVILTQQGVHGVVVPHSHVVTNSELTSATTFADIVKRLQGATTSGGTGTSSGLHGTGIESTTAQPQNLVLSQTNDNKVIASTNLRFDVAVKNTGDNLETSIPVTLTIQKQGTPFKQTQTIQVISPGQTKTVSFRNIDTTDVFGVRTTLKVDVTPVPHEARTDNNSYQYPVIFSLSG
jgi:CARDB protein